jgi:hypothetical protein
MFGVEMLPIQLNEIFLTDFKTIFFFEIRADLLEQLSLQFYPGSHHLPQLYALTILFALPSIEASYVLILNKQQRLRVFLLSIKR